MDEHLARQTEVDDCKKKAGAQEETGKELQFGFVKWKMGGNSMSLLLEIDLLV